jgi:hypothetical protein
VANGLTFHLRKDGISYQTLRVDSWKQEHKNLPKVFGSFDSIPHDMTIYRTDIHWLGYNKDYTIEKGTATDGYNNYYLPSCQGGAIHVNTYTDVTFKNLFDGVDLKWYEKNGALEYDFIIAPHTDYRNISWEIEGAESISIGTHGQLIISTPFGNIEENAPMAFQGETRVNAYWKINGNRIGFQLGSYDENEELIIDPIVRLWGTYYGGAGDEMGLSNAVDGRGNVYLAGITGGFSSLATTGAHQTNSAGYLEAFLVKFNASGTRQWGTYYGGAGNDLGISCAADTSGNIYLSGVTQSTAGISSTGAHQTTFGGGFADAFVVKFNASGARQWATYYGGSEDDRGSFCATDANGNVYLAGHTFSYVGIATSGAHRSSKVTLKTDQDAFLVKFNASGTRQWGTYYGSLGDDEGHSCATDAYGNVYLAGTTPSLTGGIATTGAHQSTFGGGDDDAFLVKFNSSGARQWGTYYGGSGSDEGISCVTDASGNVYLAGKTSSYSGIATTSAHQTAYGGWIDGFLVKFNASGTRQWGTYYGGAKDDAVHSCVADARGNIYLTGTSFSTSGVASTNAYQTKFGGGDDDAILVKFNASGARQWGTYFGGTMSDQGFSCAIDTSGNLYLAGNSWSTTGISTTNAHQATSGGGRDAFLIAFDACPSVYGHDTITACERYTWIDGKTYTSSNTTAKHTLANAEGCDSIVSLHLTIKNATSAIDSITACNRYAWIDGKTYTSSNTTAKHTLANAEGCDSIVSLHLTINYTKTFTDNIIADDSFTWINGVTYTTSNNTAIHILLASNGCDSVVSLNLTIRNTAGFNQPITSSQVNVYPNPTYNHLTIDAKNYEGVEVYDAIGRLILTSKQKIIDLKEQPKGLYLLRVHSNQARVEYKVLKE